MYEYQRIIKRVLDHGRSRGDRTNSGTLSTFTDTFYHDMDDGFPLPTLLRTHLKLAFGELMWNLNGETENWQLKERGVGFWNSWALPEGSEIYVDDLKVDLASPYGEGMCAFRGTDGKRVNQVDYILDLLEKNPESRRIMIVLWNPSRLPDESITPQENILQGNNCLTPCHWAIEFYVEELDWRERAIYYVKQLKKKIGRGSFGAMSEILEDIYRYANNPNIDALASDVELMEEYMDNVGVPRKSLSLKWHQRSVDSIIGLKYNIAYYGIFLKIVAQQFNFKPGALVGDLTNVHIYNYLIPVAEEIVKLEPAPLPELRIVNPRADIRDYEWSDIELVNYNYVLDKRLTPAV